MTAKVVKSSEPRYLVPGEPSKRLGLFILCVGLVVLFGSLYDNFATFDNGVTTLMNVASVLIAGIGSMMLLVSGNVDLSIGSQMALIGVVVAKFAENNGNLFVATSAGLICGSLLGLVNGLLVRYMKISPLIVTIGTASIFLGMAYWISGGRSIYGFTDAFIAIGRGKTLGVSNPVIVSIVLLFVCGLWMLRSRAGLRLYAIGGNPNAAKLNGIKVDRTIVFLYIFNGFLMGIVSVLLTSRLGSGTPALGQKFELDVLTAVILGGVAFAGGSGHPIGIFVGVATIGILNAGLIFAGFEDYWQNIAKGLVLLLALGFDQFAIYRNGKRIRNDTGNTEVQEDVEVAFIPGATSEDEYGIGVERSGKFGDVILACQDLHKQYGSLKALTNGTFSVRRGEVVCLVGDNGAGKSTLIKLLSGVYKPDSGKIIYDGHEVDFDGPYDARKIGIETVYQDLAICANLGVAHNMVLGDEPSKRFFGVFKVRDDKAAVKLTQERLTTLGIDIKDLNRTVARLSGGQRQSVAIARAMKSGVKVAILDEPTAALGVTQTKNVLRIVRQAAEAGAGVILISHDIRTVLAIADRIVVLRLGTVVFDGAAESISHTNLLHLMAGLPEQ
jgi:ribose/xylose/arabinose/galactoside ABC-type transport system permease subunit/ABC-type branched-subunit amino acid transport system ATPase component